MKNLFMEGCLQPIRCASFRRSGVFVRNFPMQPRTKDLFSAMAEHPIDPGVRIGHVHLKVADLERSLNFYCGVLGFQLKCKNSAIVRRLSPLAVIIITKSA